MERSGSQKFLLVISIIQIIFGALALIVGLLGIVGMGAAGAAAGNPSATGITAEDAQMATAGFGIIVFVGVFSGGLSILEGILGVRAANDNQKIMPVWVLSIIGLALGVVSVIMSIVQQSFAPTQLVSVAISALMFWVANNIKQEAGK